MKAYRLVRVLIHPGKETAYVAVVARTAGDGSNVDRVLLRSTVAPLDVGDLGSLLRAVARECSRAAERL